MFNTGWVVYGPHFGQHMMAISVNAGCGGSGSDKLTNLGDFRPFVAIFGLQIVCKMCNQI